MKVNPNLVQLLVVTGNDFGGHKKVTGRMSTLSSREAMSGDFSECRRAQSSASCSREKKTLSKCNCKSVHPDQGC